MVFLYYNIYATATTIADNFTILEAVNNVTIIESAVESKRIQSLSFLEFLKRSNSNGSKHYDLLYIYCVYVYFRSFLFYAISIFIFTKKLLF